MNDNWPVPRMHVAVLECGPGIVMLRWDEFRAERGWEACARRLTAPDVARVHKAAGNPAVIRDLFAPPRFVPLLGEGLAAPRPGLVLLERGEGDEHWD